MNAAPPVDLELLRRDPARFALQIRGPDLYMDGVSLAAIAGAFGTPTYVYSSAHIEARYRQLEAAMAGRPTRLCYAMKANSNQAILRLLARLGAGADIVSGGELQRALAAGISGDGIVFSGVGKSDEEIDAALEASISSFNVESAEELTRIDARARASGRRAPVSLRINPDVDPDTHPYLATGLREAKFGIPMRDAAELARRAATLPGIDFLGLACHIGSQITEAQPFLDSLARMRELMATLAEAGISLRRLDLGGGLGISYRDADPVVEVARWGEAIVDATCDLELELVLEPGRFLVGNGGVLLTRVLGNKRGEDKHFVIVDAAMNDLLRPALYEAYHGVVPARLPAEDAPLLPVDLVGPVCECGDFFARSRPMPVPATDELLVILSAGAYGMSMASSYNTRALPAEVLVHEGEAELIRPRQSLEELIAADRVPDWLR